MEELNDIIRSCQEEHQNKSEKHLHNKPNSSSSEDDLFAVYGKSKDKHKSNKNTLESSVELTKQKLMYEEPKLEKEENKVKKNITCSSSSSEKSVLLSPSASIFLSPSDFLKTNEEDFVQSVSFHKNSKELYESVDKKFDNFSLCDDNKTTTQEKKIEDSVSPEGTELQVVENKPETSSNSQERSYNENSNYFEM